MRDGDRLAGAAREGERRPLAVLRWCNAIACHFFYALCFSCVERVERVSRKAASSLFHARENATNLNFFEVASPRPPVHAESRLVRERHALRLPRVAEAEHRVPDGPNPQRGILLSIPKIFHTFCPDARLRRSTADPEFPRTHVRKRVPPSLCTRKNQAPGRCHFNRLPTDLN